MSRKILHFFFFLLAFPKHIRSESEVGWISSCTGGFNISSFQCSNGVWLDKYMQPDCVCVKGLWVLSTKLCGYNELLLFGNGHCFSSKKNVRKIAYIGSPFSAFSPATFVSEKNKKLVFQPFENLSLEGGQSIRIIRINPKTDYYYQLQSQPMVCIDQAFRNVTPSLSSFLSSFFGEQTTNTVSIIKFTRSPSFLQLLENPQGKQCVLQKSTLKKDLSFENYQLTPGQGMYLATEQIITSDKKCAGNCQSHKRVKRGVKPTTTVEPPTGVKGYYGYGFSGNGPFDEKTVKRYITEQNVRIIKSELNYMKYLDTPDELRLNDSTYQFLEFSRVILNTMCPLADIPEALTKAVNRLFRFILIERWENNMYGKLDVEESEHAQVMTVLETCYNQSDAMQIVTKYTTNQGSCQPDPKATTDKNSHWGENPPLACDCKKEYIGLALNATVNNTCTNLDNAYEFNYPSRDFIVETMWKIFQFTHFQCAKFFAGDGRAASVFHERLERLFHADVIFRWHRPGDYSEKLWNYFFMAYNLKQFAKAMDVCLCGAQYWSDYPRPMQRPKVPVFKKKRSLDFEIDSINNEIPEAKLNGQCLQHPWDPVQTLNAPSC